ncbi:MAG TPA: sigma 54-interacting transcriptional regulator [Terriglobales bacterium]|jgi:DNA-binding NtrC family response regulator|nr:sigma 54-interacting transcriptional regulator [Terriglobales bacterium]
MEPNFLLDSEDSEPVVAAQREKVGHSVFLEGVSPSMRALEVVMRELTQSAVPVLLLAETGAGKRTIARRIHETSCRHGEEFRIVGCAELKPQDFEQNGREAQWGPGTVFLEEVCDLDHASQSKLIEKLSEAEEIKKKENGTLPLRTRLICGSARDLESEVRLRKFREDLYYRISGVCLRLPPLRQRKEDIPYFMNFFLAKYARDFRRPVPDLSEQTQQLFNEYAWPGNIRELADAAKAIVALGDEAVAMGGLRALLTRSDRSGSGEKVSLKQAARAASREAEKELILKVLTRTRWNRRRAAQELQISYKALLYKLKQIGCGEFGVS